ncbi:MAG: histidinol dehydrogenase [Planctomycetia bacterium]|nr:histidinol dehydrogenase [Planctomycetia bacterium]
MSIMPLAIRQIDCSRDNAAVFLQLIRDQLSPDGEIVPASGQALTKQVFGEALSPSRSVERICQAIRQQGFASAQHFSKAFDRFDLTESNLSVAASELEAAHRKASPEFLKAVRQIRQNVLTFQLGILNRDARLEPKPGTEITLRYRPLRRIGVCVPGGAAAYPSTLLMSVIPAQAAGVTEIIVVAPPTSFGANNTNVLAVCHELGVKEVYRLGGAQAVASMAYGLGQLLPAVDMIVGPGNLFVALAKKYVYGHVGIDSIAGPSEVVVLADDSADPSLVALDLIAQAEHSPGASLLITWSSSLADQVKTKLEYHLNSLSRSELINESLERFGAIIVARDEDEAITLTNSIAPEHLHIQTRQCDEHADRITNAGAIFLGPHTPVAVGDYAAGPSHVLPTGGTARFAHGLNANDFLKPMSIVKLDQTGLDQMADSIETIAAIEGLTGHAKSVSDRRIRN